MSRTCDVCGKTVSLGHNVSYSKRRTRRLIIPNLRWADLTVNGRKAKVKICMGCLKSVKNNKVSGMKYLVESRKPVEQVEKAAQVDEEKKELKSPSTSLRVNKKTENLKERKTAKLKYQKAAKTKKALE